MQVTNYFAPAGRVDAFRLAEQQQLIIDAPFVPAVMNAVSEMMLVLNAQRQIVALNQRVMHTFGVTNPAVLIGLRPGEAVHCIHCGEGPDGCGTGETCSTCGAVLTILASQRSGKQANGECRLMLSLDGGTAQDFAVQATPLDIAESTFTLVALKDISAEKRRKVLERTFFHDVLNMVGGISGIANLMVKDLVDEESDSEFKQMLVDLSENLAEEITQQRRLLSAESGEYQPDKSPSDLNKLLDEVCKLYGNHIRTPDRSVTLEKVSECQITTDAPMLRRVIGNMVINALEASPAGGMVKLSLLANDRTVTISVSNTGQIPHDVQLNIFQRSFSTKSSSGRGIGTYSMKLFGERYLGGQVGFTSQEGQTTFFIRLPLNNG